MQDKEINIWEGIFEKFPDDDPDKVFEDEQWIENISTKALQNIQKLESGRIISHTAVKHEYPLSTLVAMLISESSSIINILDLGGGLGATYVQVFAVTPSPERFKYYIIETKSVCKRGLEIFSEYSNIYFQTELPKPTSNTYDIIHAGSSFQYIKDWKQMLIQFSQYQPQYIVFGNLLAGEINTFITYQNYYGKKIPVRFFNLNEILGELYLLGYKLIYKSLLVHNILGEVQSLPTMNFPEQYRLDYGCNLILKKYS